MFDTQTTLWITVAPALIVVAVASWLIGWTCGFVRAVKLYCTFENSIVEKLKNELENKVESR